MVKRNLTDVKKIQRTEIIAQLAKLGFTQFKQTGSTSNKIIILVSDRQAAFKIILNHFPQAVRDTTISGSSLGGILLNNFQIICKPLDKQGNLSSGKQNETVLCDKINDLCTTGHIDVVFRDRKKVKVIELVQRAVDVARMTKARAKADIELHTLTEIVPVSIKMSNAVFWESSVKYFRQTAIEIMEQLLANGEIQLQHTEANNFKIKPDIAIKATDREIVDVVFGADLASKGCVVKQTFCDTHFHFSQVDRRLFIELEQLITELTDVSANDIHFIIINKTNRPDFKPMINEHTMHKPCYGLFLRAADKKRLNKTVKVINRTQL
jgi:hypothetical protein